MTDNKYIFHRFFLYFRNKEIESLYKNYVLDRTMLFCRLSWGLIIFLVSTFKLLDRQMFGDSSSTVLIVRIIIIALAILILVSTYSNRLKRFLHITPSILILSIGLFSIFLIVHSNLLTFNPYFTGLLFAFTGILSIAGLGFRYSFFALLINLFVFEIVLGFLKPVPYGLFVIYNFFLLSMILIFTYIGYLIERILRKNYIVSTQLYNSLEEVQKLSGLLPICAKCKKIRDDDGYWQKVEYYISKHTEVEFSHGLCPSCENKLYGKEEWYIKKKKKNEE